MKSRRFKKAPKAFISRKKKKANARSLRGRPVITVPPPNDREATPGEIARFRDQILTAAERIVPLEERCEFTSMTATRLNRNVTQALAFFMEDGQRMVCVEEMAELIQLLCRACLQKEAPKEHIQEEIADVYITVAQMARLYFSGKDEFNQVVNRKLAKQEEKLNAARALLMS